MTGTRLAHRPSETEDARQPRRRRDPRRLKAVLAGGLVLGVGAAVTLAAWNDSEFATGIFSAGAFDLEGSTTSATTGFADHESAAGAAGLVFTTPFDNLSPDDVVYAPFWVRLATGTTNDATLAVESLTTTDTAGANSAELSYSVVQLAGASATCDAAGVAAGTVLASGTELTSDSDVDSDGVALAAGDPTTDAGTAVPLCVVVTAGADLAEGGVTTSTWQFLATSVDG